MKTPKTMITAMIMAIRRLLGLGPVGYHEHVGGKHAKQRKQNPRRKPVPGCWSHHDAPPRIFAGKINFRRSDPRHMQHPWHDRYMRIARRYGQNVVIYPRSEPSIHDEIMAELREELGDEIHERLTG